MINTTPDNSGKHQAKVCVGITGQSGFIGGHLYSYLSLKKEQIELIPFDDSFFNHPETLVQWAKKCDSIIHLAAVNRHENEQILFDTNVQLTEKLIDALNNSGRCRHVIMSSSIQEERDNAYGKSKIKCRELLSTWTSGNSSVFTGMIIPNVFGPFGKPFYNSVIATFCQQLTHSEKPEIHIDGELKLICVQELAEIILQHILERTNNNFLSVPFSSEKKVSDILKYLVLYKEVYYEKGVFPELNSKFEIQLFNTFRSYIDYKNYFPFRLISNRDERGSFTETVKSGIGGQFSYSTTRPGVTRGNHFHTRKIERFVVIKGQALIKLRKTGTDELIEYSLNGDNPAFVDMPIWYTHNITNIGSDELYTLFWSNEYFNPLDPDTFYEPV